MHWYALPMGMRNRLWAAYRPGQEDDKAPSHAYCLVARECVEFVAQREGRVPDTQLYDLFLREVE
jgi:hypothetical protein